MTEKYMMISRNVVMDIALLRLEGRLENNCEEIYKGLKTLDECYNRLVSRNYVEEKILMGIQQNRAIMLALAGDNPQAGAVFNACEKAKYSVYHSTGLKQKAIENKPEIRELRQNIAWYHSLNNGENTDNLLNFRMQI